MIKNNKRNHKLERERERERGPCGSSIFKGIDPTKIYYFHNSVAFVFAYV
jgi:hypothetical protein